MTPDTAERAAFVTAFEVSSGNDFVLVTAPDSFNVQDGKIVQNIKDELAVAGIRAVEFGQSGLPAFAGNRGKGVIVITGHASKELSAFIAELGDAGYFRKNLVILNTCQSEVSRDVANSVTSKYGAKGVLSYEGRLPIDLMEDLLVDLSSRIRAG